MKKKVNSILLIGMFMGFIITAVGVVTVRAETNHAEDAAKAWVAANQDVVAPWTEGVDGTGKSTTIGYVSWAGEVASTHVMKEVLELAGWEVSLTLVDVGPLYTELAKGEDASIDFTTSAWLPATQKSYWDTHGDNIDMVRYNLQGCKIGLAVPKYTYDSGITSIADLNENADKFDGVITGIDSGAGMMGITEDLMEADAYDLNEFTLQASSEAGMLAALSGAIEDEKDIVVTLWSPHTAFSLWDLEWLEDPLNEYGDADNVATLARQGLSTDDADLYTVLERFSWTLDQIGEVMLDIQQREDAASEAQISGIPVGILMVTMVFSTALIIKKLKK